MMRLFKWKQLWFVAFIAFLLYGFYKYAILKKKHTTFEKFTRADYLENVPLEYLQDSNVNIKKRYNASCAKYPTLEKLQFSNLYWQTLQTSNGTFQLLGAYLDNRPKNLKPCVRFLAMIDRLDPVVSTFCQFWFGDSKQPVITKTEEYRLIWFQYWGVYKQYQPHLITCVIPPKYANKIPQSVSMVEEPCENATNNLKLIYNNHESQEKKGFAVCVKGLDFPVEDLSVKIIEWIELLGILGASKIFFYELQIHPKIKVVLDYYEQLGKIQLTPLTLPGGEANVPILRHRLLSQKAGIKRQNEIIPYNDCFYKHMYEYKYIALLDIDEVIMPLEKNGWADLMDQVEMEATAAGKEYGSFNFRNVYFLDEFQHQHHWHDDIPHYMHMLQHVYRSRNYSKKGEYVKCFHNTEKVILLHNHFPIGCLRERCTSLEIDTGRGQLQHYRQNCQTGVASCEEIKKDSVMDSNIWRFKDLLMERVKNTMDALDF